MNDLSTYKQALLLKYMAKTISDSERHELEKLALDDPFLFDALQGYTESEKTFTEVKFNSEEKDQRNNLVPFRRFLTIAASFLILAFAIFLLKPQFENQSLSKAESSEYADVLSPSKKSATSSKNTVDQIQKESNTTSSTFDFDKAKELNPEEETEEKGTEANDLPNKRIESVAEKILNEESEPIINQVDVEQPAVVETALPPVTKPAPTQQKEVLGGEEIVEVETLDDVSANKKDATTKSRKKDTSPYFVDGVRVTTSEIQNEAGESIVESDDLALAQSNNVLGNYLLKGRVVDNQGNGIIGANVYVLNTAIGTITDIEGNFEIESSEDMKEIEVSYTGYETSVMEVLGLEDITVHLDESLLMLDEVVVTGLGKQNSNTFRPEMGYQSFNEYLEESTRGMTACSGVVKIRFTITTDGDLKDYVIIDSLSDICNQEAIRILQESGKWFTIPPRQQTKKELVIEF